MEVGAGLELRLERIDLGFLVMVGGTLKSRASVICEDGTIRGSTLSVVPQDYDPSDFGLAAGTAVFHF